MSEDFVDTDKSQNESQVDESQPPTPDAQKDIPSSSKSPNPQFQKPQVTKRKRVINTGDQEDLVSRQLRAAGTALENLTSKATQPSAPDAPALFGQLLAEKLRRLSLRTRLVLQNKIDNLVFEAELNEILNPTNSYTISNTPSSSPNSAFTQPPSPNLPYSDHQFSFPSTSSSTNVSNNNPSLSSPFQQSSCQPPNNTTTQNNNESSIQLYYSSFDG